MKFWDQSWNPIVGCTPKSEGCDHCWAKRQYERFQVWHYGDVSFETVRYMPERLYQPLHWRKPRRIFVCDMSDLFHDVITHEVRTEIFDAMCSWRWPNKAAQREGDDTAMVDPGHTFYVVTKRPENIRPWLDWVDNSWPGASPLQVARDAVVAWTAWFQSGAPVEGWPKHIWMIVTAENQARFDERVPILFDAPVSNRGVLLEPLLGPIKLSLALGRAAGTGLDWAVVGGETGPGARPMNPDWARSIRDQCQAAGVPFFMKQMSGRQPIPADLLIREWPR